MRFNIHMERFRSLGWKHFAVALLAVVFIAGCKKDKEDAIPGYILIPGYEIKNTGVGPFPQQAIVNMWVYADGELRGAFPLNKPIPILFNGATELTIFPGVKVNGSIETPDIYPFLKPFKITRQLTATKVDTINPVFEFQSNVYMDLNENFEISTSFNHYTETDTTIKLTITTDEASTGSGSGVITLTPTKNFFHVSNGIPLTSLNVKSANPIWVEFEYKNDMPVVFGISSQSSSSASPAFNDYIYLYPKSEWNKVYFNLSTFLNEIGEGSFRLYFYSQYDTNIGGDTQHFRIDNVRLIRFI